MKASDDEGLLLSFPGHSPTKEELDFSLQLPLTKVGTDFSSNDRYLYAPEITHVDYVYECEKKGTDPLSQLGLLTCELDDIPAEKEKTETEIRKENCQRASSNIPVLCFSTGFLEGTHFSAFLSTFVIQTKKCGSYMVKTEIIQKYISGVPYDANHTGYKNIAAFKGSHTYVLAAVGLGALQANFFCATSHHNHYNLIKKSLKGYFGEEVEEVIFAHIVISLYCRMTGRIHDFRKHSGFARVLLNLPGMEAPEYIKQSYTHAVVTPEIVGLKGIECVGLHLIYAHVKDFELKFPSLVSHLEANQTLLISTDNQGYMQEIAALHEFLQTVDARTLIVAVIMPAFIHQVVTNTHMNKAEKAQVLQEVLSCQSLLLTLSRTSTTSMSLTYSVMSALTEMFQSFFFLDFEDVELKLQNVVKRMDSFLLCSWNIDIFDAKHILHLMVIVLSCLQMHTEYAIFLKKVNPVLTFMKKTQLVENLPPIGHALDAICEENCCSSDWLLLP